MPRGAFYGGSGAGLAVEAGEAMAHVRGVVYLALLAVADHVHAGLDLLPHDVGDGPTDARLECGRIGRDTRVVRLEHRDQVGGPGQAARVRGQDTVGASLHVGFMGGERNLTYSRAIVKNGRVWPT